MLSPTLLAAGLDVRGIFLRRPHLWCLLEAEIRLEHQRCLHRFPPLSESSIPNATILSVTCLRKWIAQNSTNKMTHLPLNAKEIAVSPSVLSARRFFSLGSWSTRKSTSSLKENVSFFWWTSWGPTITGCFPLCLFTSMQQVLVLSGGNAKGPQVKRRIYLEYREVHRICAKFSYTMKSLLLL